MKRFLVVWWCFNLAVTLWVLEFGRLLLHPIRFLFDEEGLFIVIPVFGGMAICGTIIHLLYFFVKKLHRLNTKTTSVAILNLIIVVVGLSWMSIWLIYVVSIFIS